MRLLFLSNKDRVRADNLYELNEHEARHLSSLRVSVNDEFRAVTEQQTGTFIIRKIGRRSIVGEFIPEAPLVRPEVTLTLFLGLPKERALWPIAEKASELGLDEIGLIPLARSDRRMLSDQQMERMGRIAVEGCKQSGNPFIPRIKIYPSLSAAAFVEASATFSLRLVADEGLSKCGNGEQICSLLVKTPVEKLKKVCIFIGPEGGITGDERATLNNLRFLPVGCGPLILRTETAAIGTLFLIGRFQHRVE